MSEEDKSRRLNAVEREYLHELVSEKLSKIKELCDKLYPEYNKNDYSYDKNLQIRNEVMRRVKFEQIKRSSLPNFIRDTKKYLLNKRNEIIERKNKKDDIDSFSLNNIKLLDSNDKIEIKISDQSLKPKQIDFINFVLNNIKKDGQKVRTKDLQVKKMLMDLFSHDLKKYADDKETNMTTQQLFENNAEIFVNKHNKNNILTDKISNNIVRKVVPKLDSIEIQHRTAAGI